MTRPGEDLGPAEIEQLLAGGPGEAVAFVPSNPSPARLAETLIALANTHGGVVLLGAGANGKPLGVADEVAAKEAVRAAGLLATPPLILPVVAIVEVAEKTLCAAYVPPGLSHVYSLNGRYLARAGARNRLLSATELTALLLSRDESGFEARPAPSAALADLDRDAVDGYVAGLPGTAGEGWQRVLLDRGCLTELGGELVPTYAGILLFGRQPQRFLRNAAITLIRYPGAAMGDDFVRDEATGRAPCANPPGGGLRRRKHAPRAAHPRPDAHRGDRVSARGGSRGDRQRGGASRLCHPWG